MRRLVMVVAALLFAGTATADDQKLGSTGQEAKEAGQAAARDTKEGAQQAGQWTKEQAQKADQTADQMGDKSRANDNAQTHDAMHDQHAASDEQARDRMKKDDFDIEGKVSKVSKSSLSLARDEATMVTLHVDKATKIEVDGNAGRLSQLKPGQDVKASFNLKGDKPMAIEIKADTKK